MTYLLQGFHSFSATTKPKRVAWNKGKKKPIVDDGGLKWCNCDNPKLTSNAGGRGLAMCLLCSYPWYH